MNEIVFLYKLFSAFKYALLDLNGWVAVVTVAIVTAILLLVTLSLYVKNQRDKKRNQSKLQNAITEVMRKRTVSLLGNQNFKRTLDGIFFAQNYGYFSLNTTTRAVISVQWLVKLKVSQNYYHFLVPLDIGHTLE